MGESVLHHAGFPQLATPADVARLRADADRDLYIAKSDLTSYYFQLELPEWAPRYFAIPSLSAEELGDFYDPAQPDRVFPAFVVVPMGWSHSVLVAQDAHLYMATTAGKQEEEHRVKAGTPPISIGACKWLIYIDDCVWLGHDLAVVHRAQQAYLNGMRVENVEVSGKKLVLPRVEATDVLGVSLDGRTHEFGVHCTKLDALIAATNSLLARLPARARNSSS